MQRRVLGFRAYLESLVTQKMGYAKVAGNWGTVD